MSDNTGIEWTKVPADDGNGFKAGATWNPVTGCSKVSEACKHCYAERDWGRLSANPKATKYFGRKFTDVQCHPEVLDQPLRWQKPRGIFVNSMSDLFHEDVPDKFIEQVFAVMALAKQHTFLILTKRPERLQRLSLFTHSGGCLWVGVRQEAESLFGIDPGAINKALPNVWIGVTVENQKSADERIPLLLQTPAAARFVSCEPLLDDLTLDYFLGEYPEDDDGAPYPGRLHWVIAGGESGPKARPSHPEWFRSLRDQCQEAGVPFFFKQWGEWRLLHDLQCADSGVAGKPWFNFDPDTSVCRVGKNAAGRLLDGCEWIEFPKLSA